VVEGLDQELLCFNDISNKHSLTIKNT